MEIKRYEFDSNFQTAILGCILIDKTFLKGYRDVIDPEYFNDECYRLICIAVLRLFDKHKETPYLDAVTEELNSMENSEELKDALHFVSKKEIESFKAIEEKAINFAKNQAVQGALRESFEILPTGDYEGIKAKINDAILVGEGADGDYKYEDTLVDRLNSYDEPEEFIPIGLPAIDKALEGGTHRKEMGLIIAPPSGGKTTALIHMGKHALLNGFNVVHYSLELRKQRVARRYDMSIAEMTRFELAENKRTAGKKILESVKGELVIQEYPASSITCDTLANHLNRLRNRDFRIDVIIVDYDDLLNPTRQYGESRGDVKKLYKEIRGLSFEFNCTIWTATQTNKKVFEMQEGEVIGGKEATESLEGKMGTPDLVLSCNQTFREYKAGSVRMHIAKNREGTAKITEPYNIDYSRMLIS